MEQLFVLIEQHVFSLIFLIRWLFYLCRWYLVPRVLRNVSTVDLSVCVLGEKLSMPICVAATAMQRMAHPDGETAVAKGTKVSN